MKNKFVTLMKMGCILFILSMSVGSGIYPSVAQEDASRLSATDSLPTPLPLTCSGSPVPSVCAYGYVYYDGLPVSGASLHIDSAYGDLDTSTASGSASSDPYYYVNLSASPLLVSAGDVITITAEYNAHTTSMSYQVGTGGQQIDVAIVINPVPLFGDGGDGDLVVEAGQTIYIDNIRSALAANANSGQSNLTIINASSFLVGQEVLVIQIQGNGAGSYEFGEIAMINGNTITLQNNLINSYEIGGNSRAQVLVVHHYHNVTVKSGGVLTMHSWDGTTGGMIAYRCNGFSIINGTLNVNGGNGFGTNTTGQGYGVGGGFYGGGAFRRGAGTSFQGEGTGGIGNQNTGPNGNGSGGSYQNVGNAGGTGGTNGTQGSQGTGWLLNNVIINVIIFGTPGDLSGNLELTTMTFGGGGSGGSAENNNDGLFGGGGGSGGGIIFIGSKVITVTGFISAIGGSGGNGEGASGGGGAGGSILLKGKNLTLGTNLIVASGGAGGTHGMGLGGAGGLGRIRIDYSDSFSGTTNPPASIAQREIHTGPIITINTIYPDIALQDSDLVAFRGTAVDNDEYGSSITQYVWRSDLDGLLSTQANFLIPASNLSEGTHTIYFKAKDDEGEWSEEISRTLTVSAPSLRYIYLPNIVSRIVDFFPGTWEVEPNNSWDQANGPLRSSIDYHGYPNDQKDYFSIYTFNSGNIIIELTNHMGTDVQLQLFYNSIDNRVAYDPSPPYHINYPGQPGWYYIYIYTGSGFTTSNSYTLNVDYP